MGTKLKSTFCAVFLIALFAVTTGSAIAAEYYVSPTGRDGNSGSRNSPWLTLAYAESRLSQGDTLFFRGGTYKPQDVTINVPGVTFKAYPGENPIINCQWNFPRASGYPNDYPSVLYMPVIRISASNVTIDGISITKSRGVGIETKALNFIIKNCTITYSQHIGISIKNVSGTENGLVENCEVTYSNHARDNKQYITWSNIVCNIAVRGSRNTVRGCVIAFSPAAGLEGYQDEYSLYENNIIFGNLLTQIHEAESNYCTIRNNLIYGTRRPGVPNTEGFGTGVELMCELWYDGSKWDKGHEVYGNYIANTKIGIRIGYQKGKNTKYPNNAIKSVKIHGNTVIQPSTLYTGSETNHSISIIDGSHLGYGHEIKNNIFWQKDGGISHGNVNASKVKVGYNLWSKAPTSGFRSTTDPTYDEGYPTLRMADYFPKTSGWNNLPSNETALSIADFRILQTATHAIDNGTTMPNGSHGEAVFLDIRNTNLLNGKYAYQKQDSSWDIGASLYNAGASPLLPEEKDLAAPSLSIVVQ